MASAVALEDGNWQNRASLGQSLLQSPQESPPLRHRGILCNPTQQSAETDVHQQASQWLQQELVLTCWLVSQQA